jgi:Tfp pilus assembly protein PilV
MAVLTKKIKGSTLMETLVATVLIVIVFMVASMVLNNLFASSISQNDNQVKQELLKLQYQYQNGILKVPYKNEFNQWSINVTEHNFNNESQVLFSATQLLSNKEVTYKIRND